MAYQKPELLILCLAGIAVRSCGLTTDNQPPLGDGSVDLKIHTVSEGFPRDNNPTTTSSTSSAYEADE